MTAAVAAFAARGFDATSVQDVADRARMSKQALMHHFPSKRALRTAAFDEIALRVEALFPAAARDMGEARYADVIDVVAEQFEEQPEIARFLLRELMDRPRETKRAIARMARPWLDVVTQVVDAQDEHDVDAEAHVAVLASLLLVHAAVGPRDRSAWRGRLRTALRRVLRVSSHV